MIYIFVVLIFIIFLSLFLKNSNPYEFVMIFGKKGSGKTTLIAKLSQKYIKKGYTVYSNIVISGCNLYNPKDIGLYTFPCNSVVFCDEIGLIWHNRDYKNFSKCLVEWFKYQRQYKIKFICFSQSFDIDKVLRLLTDRMYILRRFGSLSVARPISKRIGISTDSEGNGQLVDTYAYGSIFDCIITYLPRYYGFFDSFNPPPLPIIESTYKDYNEVNKMYTTTQKWLIFKFNCFKVKILIFFERVKLKFLNLLEKF